MALAKWKLLELGAVFVEADLHRAATNVTVLHDQWLPDRDTGRKRQVDGVVRFTEGGRDYLRTIEVQKRGKKIGPGDLDKFLTKADRLNAQRTTIVSEAGFTKSALERLAKHAAALDAVHMKPVRARSLPPWLREFDSAYVTDDGKGEPISAVRFERYAYVSLPAGEIWRYVFLASPRVSGTEAVLAVLIEPHAERDDGAQRIVGRALVRPGSRHRLTGMSLIVGTSDGRQISFSAQPPIDPADHSMTVWRGGD